MTTSYLAKTMLGCEVTYEMLHATQPIRVCTRDRRMPENKGAYDKTDLTDCELEDSGIDYKNLKFRACPFCFGAINNDTPTTVYATLEGQNYIDADTNFLLLVERTTASAQLNLCRWFVGHLIGTVSEEHEVSSLIPYPYTSDYRNQIQEALKPLGLWDETKFGIYTFQTGS